MRYRIEISQKAREQLRGLSKICAATLADGYRLRVGSHRILFALAGDVIQVYAVKDRKAAYE